MFLRRSIVALALISLASTGIVSLSSCAHPSAAETAKAPAAQSVALSGALENKWLRADASGEIAARIQIAAILARAKRPPVNLALVIDTSGSMEGKPIDDARKASLALLDAMSPDDRLAVVTFDSKADVLLASTPIGECDLAEVRKKIGAMRAEGTTDMAGGLTAAVQEVAGHLRSDGVNRVVLVGDGVPNVEGPVLPIAQSAAARGISITSLGLGPDYNELLMGQIAQATGGRFHFVEDSSKLRPFFDEEVARLQRVLAKNASLEIVAGPGVAVDRVIGYAAEGTSASKRIALGDVSVGDKREIVVRVATPPKRDGAAVELFDAVLRYEDGATGEAREERVFFGAHATGDTGKLASGKDDEVTRAVARAESAAGVLEQLRGDRGAPDDETAHDRAPRTKARGAEKDGPPAPRNPAPATAPEVSPVTAQSPEAQLARKRLHDAAMQTFQ